MLVVFTAAAMALQGRGEIDGIKARRVLEASRAADAWVFDQVHGRLVPDLSIVQSSGRARVRRQAFQDACARDLTNAAYEQVCDAYHVTKKQFNAIVRNPERVLSFQYIPERKVRRLMRRQLSAWDAMGTLFDPRGVRLKESLAARYGYINPRKPEPPPPSLVLEQLIGPSPPPRETTEPKADEPEELMPMPKWFDGSPEAWAAHEKWRREFAKGCGVKDYRIPGSPLD